LRLSNSDGRAQRIKPKCRRFSRKEAQKAQKECGIEKPGVAGVTANLNLRVNSGLTTGMKRRHIGSNFDAFLLEEGILEECRAGATRFKIARERQKATTADAKNPHRMAPPREDANRTR
jgi:hypothetical protein